MRKFLATALGAVIVGVMLFFGEDAPDDGGSPVATAPEQADARPDRPHTAAELSALLAEIKARPEPTGPRISAPHPEQPQPAPAAEPVPEPVLPANPDEIPMAIEALPLDAIPADRLPVMSDTYTTAPTTSAEDATTNTRPERTLDVSRLPVPRPAPRPTNFAPDDAEAAAPVTTALAGPEVLPPSTLSGIQPPPAAPASTVTSATTTDADLVALALAEALTGTRPALMYVARDGATLRSAPHPEAEQILLLYPGDEMEVLFDMGDGWLQIRDIGTGETGFVPTAELSDRP